MRFIAFSTMLLVAAMASLAYPQDIVDVDDVGTNGGDSLRASMVKINALNQLMPWDRCIYSDDFAADTGSLVNFNGGVHSYDGPNNRVQVTAGASARGVFLPATGANAAGAKHIAILDVTLGSGAVSVRSRWGIGAEGQTTITTSGKHYFTYTADGGPGGFGDRLVITGTGADTFFINSIHVFVFNDTSQLRSNGDQDGLFRRQVDDNVIAAYDFGDLNGQDPIGTNAIDNFGGSEPTINGSGQLEFTATGGGQVLGVKYGTLDPDTEVEYVDVYVDFERVDVDCRVQARWSNGLEGVLLTESGKYRFTLRRTDGQSGILAHLAFDTNSAAGTIRFNAITVSHATVPWTDYEHILIGARSSSLVTPNTSKGVVIGRDVITNQTRPILIGTEARGVHEQVFGSLNAFSCSSGNEITGIGENVIVGGWRTTAFGGKSVAVAQSSTAYGAGATTLKVHGQVFGRGAYAPDPAVIPDIDTVIAGQDIYFENSWGHQHHTPMSRISIGNKATPSNETITLHGQDAFDARIPNWDSGTSYPAPTNSFTSTWVRRGNSYYKSLAASTDVEPGVDAGWESSWYYLYDEPGTIAAPSDYNVDGGHIRIAAGRSTGTGTGGTAGFQITNGVDLGQNTKQALVDGFFVDSDYGAANTPMCYRRSDGTLRRINEEPDGTLKAIAY